MKSGGAIGLFLFTVIAVAIFFWMATRPAVDITAVQFGVPVNSVLSGEGQVVQEKETGLEAVKETEQQTTLKKEEATLESQESPDSVDSATESAQ